MTQLVTHPLLPLPLSLSLSSSFVSCSSFLLTNLSSPSFLLSLLLLRHLRISLLVLHATIYLSLPLPSSLLRHVSPWGHTHTHARTHTHTHTHAHAHTPSPLHAFLTRSNPPNTTNRKSLPIPSDAQSRICISADLPDYLEGLILHQGVRFCKLMD